MKIKVNETKADYIDVADLKPLMDLIEAEHRLSYHLQMFLKAKQEQNKEMAEIKGKAMVVNRLKCKFNSIPKSLWQRVGKEDRLKINMMFRSEGIII